MRPMTNFALACGLLFSGTVLAVEGYEATYELAIGRLSVGKMERLFSIHADGAYRFESKLRTTGLATLMRREEVLETSSGFFIDGNYIPDAYSYLRKSKKKPRNISIRFRRETESLETTINGATSTSPLRNELIDKLTFQAALMHDLGSESEVLRYAITDRGKEKVYEPFVDGSAVVDTKLGEFSTLKVVRQRGTETKRTIFWCAPALDYLPVQISHRDSDGTETIVSLLSYRKTGTAEP
jgi:hypothetical protein